MFHGKMGSFWSSENAELKIQLQIEREKYAALLTKHRILELQLNSKRGPAASSVSVEKLRDYIQTQILATTANSKYIPDPLERKIYLSVYQTILETIFQLANTTSVNLVGHEITFQIHPQTD